MTDAGELDGFFKDFTLVNCFEDALRGLVDGVFGVIIVTSDILANHFDCTLEFISVLVNYELLVRLGRDCFLVFGIELGLEFVDKTIFSLV